MEETTCEGCNNIFSDDEGRSLCPTCRANEEELIEELKIKLAGVSIETFCGYNQSEQSEYLKELGYRTFRDRSKVIEAVRKFPNQKSQDSSCRTCRRACTLSEWENWVKENFYPTRDIRQIWQNLEEKLDDVWKDYPDDEFKGELERILEEEEASPLKSMCDAILKGWERYVTPDNQRRGMTEEPQEEQLTYKKLMDGITETLTQQMGGFTEALTRQISQMAVGARQSTEAWTTRMRGAPINTEFFKKNFAKVESQEVAHLLSEFWAWLERKIEDTETREKDKQQADYFEALKRGCQSILRDQPMKDEDSVQALLTELHLFFCEKLGSPLVCRDTHLHHAPLQPHHKFDHAFVANRSSSSNLTKRVLWVEIVSFSELKKILEGSWFTDVLVQTSDNLLEVFRKQPGRQFQFSFISDAHRISFFYIKNDLTLMTTGLLPFLSPTEVTSGLLLYCSFLKSSAAQLGFQTLTGPILPDSLKGTYSNLRTERLVGSGNKATILSSESIAIKLHTSPEAFQREFKAIEILQDSNAPILKLKHFDKKDLWMSFSPYATYSLKDIPFSYNMLGKVCTTAAFMLRTLWDRKMFCVDASPSNVLIEEDEVYWNDFGLMKEFGDSAFSYFEGTRVFSALEMGSLEIGTKQRVEYTMFHDLECVFFTILSYCWHDTEHKQHPRQLPWERHGDIYHLWCHKLAWSRDPTFSVRPKLQQFFELLFAEIFEKRNSVDKCIGYLLDFQLAPNEELQVYCGYSLYHVGQTAHKRKNLVKMSEYHAQLIGFKPCENCFPSVL